MTVASDRRTLLAGLGALGLVGCGRATEARQAVVQAASLNLSDLEARHGGRIGVAIQDKAQRLGWRGDDRFTYCSTFKLFLAAATLEHVARGEERLDRSIPVTAADMISHAPVTEPAVGSTLTIEQLCQGTVELSDNPAANILIRELGGLDALRGWYGAIGDTVTRVDRMEPELNLPGDDRDTTTPYQATTNLRTVLAMPSRLTTPHRQMLTRWLVDSPTGAARIKAGVPAGWTVAHKTGTSGRGQTNDIGMITPPTGGPIQIAVYYAAPEGVSAADCDAVVAEATRAAVRALGRDGAAT